MQVRHQTNSEQKWAHSDVERRNQRKIESQCNVTAPKDNRVAPAGASAFQESDSISKDTTTGGADAQDIMHCDSLSDTVGMLLPTKKSSHRKFLENLKNRHNSSVATKVLSVLARTHAPTDNHLHVVQSK